jgi:anti-anti-sigma factor
MLGRQAMSNEQPGSSARGFRVEVYEAEGNLVVACHGSLTFENSPLLKQEVRGRIPDHKRIILDLKEVPRMDSSGLGAVAGLYVSARTRGCKLEMVNANQAVRDLFSMTNLLLLFEETGRSGGRMM